MRSMSFAWLAISAVIMLGIIHFYSYGGGFHDIDEATYAYGGTRILEGGVPYLDFFENKPPGIFYIYALSALLTPHSIVGIRLTAFLALAATLVLLLVYARKRFRENGVVILTGFIGVLAFSNPIFQPEAGLTELFSLPFLIGSFLLLQRTEDENGWRLLVPGILGGIAVTISFHSIIPLLIFGWHLIGGWKNRLRFATIVFTAGFAWVPIFLLMGAWSGIEFSLLTYPGRMLAFNLGRENRFIELLMRLIYVIPLLASLLIAAIVAWRKKNSASVPEWKWFFSAALSIWIIQSFVPHQLLIAVPPMVLLGAIGLDWMISHARRPQASRGAVALIMAGMILLTAFAVTSYRWSSPSEEARFRGEIVKSITQESDPIYVWGYQSDVYWYAERKAPTPRFFTILMTFDQSKPIPEVDRLALLDDFAENPPRVMVVMNPEFRTNPSTAAFFQGYEQSPIYEWLFTLKGE